MNSYRYPNANWLGSPNFTPDRAGHDMTQPSWVVLHTMVGTVQSANARFQQPAQQASATYGIGLDGQVYQWVDEKDSAWANGNSGVDGAIGRNEDSISIEHEDNGDYNGPRTPELYATSAMLVHDICTRYGIPIDRQHIIGHRECTGNQPTACPDSLDIDRIVAAAAAGGGLLALTDAQQMQLLNDAHASRMLLSQGTRGSTVDWTNKPDGGPTYLPDELAALQQEIANLKQPQVDVTALAAALAANPTLVNAIATATVKLLGEKESA